MNQTATVSAPTKPAPGPFKPRPKRFQPRDLGTDRSKAYNRIHNTEIANNHMLDRYLTNKEQMERGKSGR